MRRLGGAASAETRRHQIRARAAMQIDADGAKARKSARSVPRRAKLKKLDKAGRIQVVDFGRVDMPRWNNAASYSGS
jgi:hypothetical protein